MNISVLNAKRCQVVKRHYISKTLFFLLFVISGYFLFESLCHYELDCEERDEPQYRTCYVAKKFYIQTLSSEKMFIKRAYVSKLKNRINQNVNYYLELRGLHKRLYLSTRFAKKRKLTHAAYDINLYLSTSKKRFHTVPNLYSGAFYIFSTLLFVLGFIIFTTIQKMTLTLDKDLGLMMMVTKNFFFCDRVKVPLDNIHSVDVAQKSGMNDADLYRIEIKTTDGEVIPLTLGYDSLVNPKRRIVKKMQAFLGLSNEQTVKHESETRGFSGFIIFLIIIAVTGYVVFHYYQ